MTFRPALSPLTFGSMRLDRAGSVAEAAALIRGAAEIGVTTFHASQEYPTWPLFVEAWREAALDPQTVQLIAKIGVPHFGEDAFSPGAFSAKIDGYRKALGLDQVEMVQWLLRHDLKQEASRHAIFVRDAELIGDTVMAMKAADVIRGLVSFPYTAGIAGLALDADWCDGLAVYCNALELDMGPEMDAAARRGKSIVAIRPFAAGRVFTETSLTAAQAVSLPLTHSATATVVASISDLGRLQEALAAAQQAEPGPAIWQAAVARARSTLHV